MKTFNDLTGNAFGDWTVLSLATTDSRYRRYWNCRCSCGSCDSVEKPVREDHLKGAKTSGCGSRSYNHGHHIDNKKTKTYAAWDNMKRRCLNPQHPSYKNYGGRGISVYHRWMLYPNFLEDMGEAPEGYSLERINNDGNYEPDNCCWATPLDQGNNRRDNRNIIYKDEQYTVADLARHLGLDYKITLYHIDRALRAT